MDFLASTLIAHGYKKIRFKVSRTNHLVINASINGVKGKFILDTGASSTCVGTECIPLFNLKARNSATLAAGAGGTGMATQVSQSNILKIGRWKSVAHPIVIFDLSHVNHALAEYKARPVNGIIGADVLLSGHAIIDYYNHLLYLKEPL